MVKKLLMVLALAGFACAAGADVLWDQYGPNECGLCSQDFETAYDCYDCWAADDFYVEDAAGWHVRDIHWEAHFNQGPVTVKQVNFYIWPVRADGMPDFYNPVWTESGLQNKSLDDGENQYQVANRPELAGHTTYWLGVQVAMDFASWGQHFWKAHYGEGYGRDFSTIFPNGCTGSGTDWFAPYPDCAANFRITGEIVPEPGVVSVAVLPIGAGFLWLRRPRRERGSR
jgi:hypothetical protein